MNPEEWTKAADDGAQAVRVALLQISKACQAEGKSSGLVPAICLGALAAIGKLMHISVGEQGRMVAELYATTYLRGAIRGLDFPCHEDGRPFERAYDA